MLISYISEPLNPDVHISIVHDSSHKIYVTVSPKIGDSFLYIFDCKFDGGISNSALEAIRKSMPSSIKWKREWFNKNNLVVKIQINHQPGSVPGMDAIKIDLIRVKKFVVEQGKKPFQTISHDQVDKMRKQGIG